VLFDLPLLFGDVPLCNFHARLCHDTRAELLCLSSFPDLCLSSFPDLCVSSFPDLCVSS
jgi:hypothetical protein